MDAVSTAGPANRGGRVDGVNTFRFIRRSFHVFPRCFALPDSAFPQVSTIFVPGSIPGSSTEKVLVIPSKFTKPHVKIPVKIRV
jgi:hypothetical protein